MYNFSIGIEPADIALFYAMYRTSLKGRKDIAKLMFTDPSDINATEGIIDKSYTSRVAEIFNVLLKCLGTELEFEDDEDKVRSLDSNTTSPHTIDGVVYMCTDYQAFLLERMCEIREELLEEYPVLTSKKLDELIKKTLKERKYINGSLEDELGILKLSKKLVAKPKDLENYKEELSEETSSDEYDSYDEDDNDDNE
jgi:hypothetical protein